MSTLTPKKLWVCELSHFAVVLILATQFKEQWLELNANNPTAPLAAPKLEKTTSRSRFDDDSSDDDEPQKETHPSTCSASDKPWLAEFNAYMDGQDSCLMGATTMSMVSWWGVSTFSYSFEISFSFGNLGSHCTPTDLGIPRLGLPCHYGVIRFE